MAISLLIIGCILILIDSFIGDILFDEKNEKFILLRFVITYLPIGIAEYIGIKIIPEKFKIIRYILIGHLIFTLTILSIVSIYAITQ